MVMPHGDRSADCISWLLAIYRCNLQAPLTNNEEVSFKLDRGAEVTAIIEQSYQSISSPCLKKPVKRLRGPNKHPLDVVGIFTTKCHTKTDSAHQTSVLFAI